MLQQKNYQPGELHQTDNSRYRKSKPQVMVHDLRYKPNILRQYHIKLQLNPFP